MTQHEKIKDNISSKFIGLRKKEVVNLLFGWLTNENFPLVLYQNPGEGPLLMTQFGKMKSFDGGLEGLGEGFVIASYQGPQYFLEAEMIYHLESGELQFHPAREIPDFSELKGESIGYYSSEVAPSQTAKDEFIQAIEHIVHATQTTDLLKVVPSKIKLINQGYKDLDLINAFFKLCESYPNALISLVTTPETGTWLGASPEVLIDVEDAKKFVTMSLAGTQRFNKDLPLHEVPWTQKEIEEQAMVSRYIINRFKEIRLREFVEVGPRTVQAGNLVHLCSTFTVDMVETNFPDLGSVMLKLLHPTSAVCGMPKKLAQDHLEKVEMSQRRLYAGFLGPVNVNNGIHLYVNLRCMEVFEHQSALHAGAGITQYSIAEDEWLETEMKCNTLLQIINT